MEPLLTVYAVRHLPSLQNVAGFGPVDSDLAAGFENYRSSLIDLVKNLSGQGLDLVVSGDLKRHKGTADVLREAGYKGEIIEDTRLNAVMSGQLLEQPAVVTEREYNLERFRANHYKLYVSPDGKIKFDPSELGIYPFNSLYSFAYFDRRLRQLVFQNDSSLTSFQNIRGNIERYQPQLIQSVIESTSPLTVLSIGSCSPNAFNLEYCLFGTVGENLVTLSRGGLLRPTRFGSENRVIFPQGHDEVMVIGYRKEDLEAGRDRLVAIEGNLKIQGLIDRLHGRK